jgi:hypothetical protein
LLVGDQQWRSSKLWIRQKDACLRRHDGNSLINFKIVSVYKARNILINLRMFIHVSFCKNAARDDIFLKDVISDSSILPNPGSDNKKTRQI